MPETRNPLHGQRRADLRQGLPMQTRFLSVRATDVNAEARTVELSFSSETPVEQWWGTETLSHDAGAVDLSRMVGAPVLVNHNRDDVVGVVESAAIKDRRGVATIRFGQSPRAAEIMQDVADGIRSGVSVGYRIYDLELSSDPDGDGDNDGDNYLVTRWMPYEISFATIAADPSVGVGRGAEPGRSFPVNLRNSSTQEAVLDVQTIAGGANGARSLNDTLTGSTALTAPADVARQQQQQDPVALIAAERQRSADIQAIGQKFNMADFAAEHVQKGTARELFYGLVLSRLGDQAEAVGVRQASLGMSGKEVKTYRLVRALHAMANPNDRSVDAGFELELSGEIAKRSGKAPKGFYVPLDIRISREDPVIEAQRTAMTVGTNANGGYVVQTTVQAQNFIELLRNKMLVKQLGAFVLGGLVGSIAIPKQTVAGTMQWVAENNAPAGSVQTLAQVSLSPKSAGAYTDISRQLLMQSSIDVEAFVRNDLAKIIALGLDLAALHGTGSGNQPLGIAGQSGVAIEAGGTNGALATFANMVNMETDVASSNADVGSLGYLTNAAQRGKLKQQPKIGSTFPVFTWEDGQAVFGQGWGMVNGYRAGVTNQVSSALTKGTAAGVCSAIFFGNWADLIVAEWGELDILVDPYSNSTTGTVRIVAFQSCDIGVRHPGSFAAMLDAL